MTKSEIKEFLDHKYLEFNRPEFIKTDPVSIPHGFKKREDIEIIGFLAATISWGNRKSIIANGEKLKQITRYSPFEFVLDYKGTKTQRELLNGFVHRTFNADDLHGFFLSLNRVYLKSGGLQTLLTSEKSLYQNLSNFRSHFFHAKTLSRSYKHVSDVSSGSSAKRLCMYMRWMVRKDTHGVDFGVWNHYPASELALPLDVHTGNVSRKLGLLTRKQNDWKAVMEVTENLRKLDPLDPIKYDYSLFGLGVFEKF